MFKNPFENFVKLRYLGSYGNAANTVVFPLTVVALAIAVMIGDGCCAFVSISLGKEEKHKAKKSVANAVIMSVIGSVLLTVIYLIFQAQIIAMFGGTVNEETFYYSREYFFYISLGIPFYIFGQAMNPVIRADGNPNFAMVSTLAGAIIKSYCEKHQISDVIDLDGDDGCITLREVTITLNGIQVKHDIMTFFFDQIVGVTLASSNTSQI